MAHSRLEFVPGEIVFREGDPPTSAFLIERGRIEILTEQDQQVVVLSVLREGDLLGEMAIIDAAPRTATARAQTAATLIPIDGNQLSERIENSDPIVKALLKGQLARYRMALQNLRGQPIAKYLGNEHLQIVQEDGDRHAVAKIHLEMQLRDALKNRALDIRYQPIYDIRAQRIAGYEALARWKHPIRGQISPVEFIALAEETSLILPVGQYVLECVAQALAEFKGLGVSELPFIAVNISGRQFAELDLLASICEIANAHGVDPRFIKIEVTESLTLDVSKIAELINRAQAMGIKVALDDFGTGFSNFGHLHKLRFNTVKLDQGFIRQMLEAPRCHAIVRAIVDMVHTLEADLVAEGVETEAQLAALAVMNCRYAQGYLIGKPQTLQEIISSFTQTQ